LFLPLHGSQESLPQRAATAQARRGAGRRQPAPASCWPVLPPRPGTPLPLACGGAPGRA